MHPFVKYLRVLLFFGFLLQVGTIVAQLNITTSGQTGTSGTNWSISGNTLTVSGGSASVHPSVITDFLTNTGDLTVNVVATSGTERSLTISNNIAYTGNTARTLTFKSANNITVASGVNITSSNAAMNLVLRSALGSGPDYGRIILNAPVINTNGGHFWAGGNVTDATWNGLTVGDGAARTWADDEAALYLVGGSITTGGGNLYMAGMSYNTSDADGINYGIYLDNCSISSGAGQIDIDGSLLGKYTNGDGLRIYANTGNVSITSTSGAINVTATGTDGSGTNDGWRHAIVLYTTSSYTNTISSTSGNIKLNGAATFSNTIGEAEGVFLGSSTADGVKITSRSGTIDIWGSNSRDNTGYSSNSIRFSAGNTSNAIRIGYDGTNSYNGNITLQGNSIYQANNNAGSGSISVQSTGSLTIQSSGNNFTYMRAGASGSLTYDDDWNFGSSLSSFTFGKSTNTNDLNFDNILTVAGPITFYVNSFTINRNMTSSTASDITINANVNFSTSANRQTITTAGGNITIWADKDANGNGVLDLDYLTLNPGAGNIILRGETVNWTITNNTDKPYINGTGSLTFEPSDAAFGQGMQTTWFNFDQDGNGMSGLTLGKSGNTADITLNVTGGTSVAGPIDVYGGAIALSANLTTTNTSTGNISLNATTVSGSSNLVLASGRTATINISSNSTYAGIVSGTNSGLTKSGAGTLTLTNDHTYTGATTITAGDLQVGSGGSLSQASSGSINAASAVSVASGSKLILSPNDNLTFGNNVSGAGGLEIKGVSGRYYNTFLSGTAATIATNSTVLEVLTRITGGLESGTAIGGTNLVAGAYIKSYDASTNTASLQFQQFDNTYTKVVFASLLQSGSNVQIKANTTAYGTGAAYKSGNGLGTDFSTGASSMTLATTSGGSGYGIGEVYMSGKVNLTGTLTYTGTTTLSNTVTSVSSPNSYSYTSRGTQEITDASSSFPNGSAVVNNGLVILNRSTALTIANDMSGTEEVLQVGAAVTMTGANTYTGNTTIDLNKSLSIGSGSTTGSMAGNIINYGSLTFNRSDAYTYTGVISGSGTLTKSGAGAFTMTGLNTYTGATTINTGSLILQRNVPATSSSGFSGAGTLVIQPSSTSFTSAVTYPITGFSVSSDIGGLTVGKSGNTANITFTSATQAAGAIDVYGGAIALNANLATTNTSTGNISLNATTISGSSNLIVASGRTATINVSSNSTYAGIVSGTNSGLTKSGAGTLTLTNDHTYTGATTISAGDLQVGSGGSLSQASSGSINAASAVSVASGSKLILSPNDNLTFGSNVSGAGGLEIKGVSGRCYNSFLTGTAATIATNSSVLEVITRITGGLESGTAIGGTNLVAGAYSKSYDASTNTASLQFQQYHDNATKVVFASLLQSGSDVQIKVNTTLYGTGAAYKSGNGLGTDFSTGATSMSLATTNGGSGYGIAEVYMSGKVNLTGTLTYTGTTTLSNTVTSVSSPNTYSYTSRGTQEITDASSSFPSGSAVVNNGLVILNRSTALTIANDMSGTEEVLQVGAAVTMTGANTYTGNTTIDLNKSLSIGSGSTTGSITGNIINYGSLTFNRSDAYSYSGVISGSGTLTKSGAGAFTMTGLNTYTGASTINAGSLILERNVPATSSSGFSGAGTLVIQPSSSSFTSALTYPITGFSVSSGIGGLTVGKSGNTANIYVTGATQAAGPITFYGDSIAVNDDITASSSGNISLFGNKFSFGVGKTITSSGQLFIAPQTVSTTIGIAGGNGSLSLPATCFSTNFADGFSNITIGSDNQTGTITANAFTLRDPVTFKSSGLALGGLITIGDNDVTLDARISSIGSASASNYFKTSGSGKVKRNIANSSSFAFAIGNASYNPVAITNNSGSADDFSGRVVDGVYDGGTTGTQILSPIINRTWDIGKTNPNGGAGINFSLQWDASQEQGIISSYKLNHYSSGAWSLAEGTSGTPSGNPTKTMTHTGYTGTFSPFAVGASPFCATNAVITNNTGSTTLTCATTSISLTASGGVSYSWSDGTSVVGSSASLNVTTPGTYTVTVTEANSCSDTAIIVITQNSTKPSVTCPANASYCSNISAFTLTGGLPAGGIYSGTGVSSGQFDPAIAGTGAKVIKYAYIDPANGCSDSCTFTITVNPADTPAVSISSDQGSTICTGTRVTFTATPTDGGTPSYQWKLNNVNVGGDSAKYVTDTLKDGDVIKVVMSSSLSCVTSSTAESNAITVAVNSYVTPSVSITSSDADNIYCTAAGSITFTATPVNGGGTPSYQWKKNGVNVGTNSPTYTTSTLANNDVVKVILTSDYSCRSKDTASSNTITTTVINTTGELWLGGTSTDWFTASNWCSGSVPSASSSVTIPAGQPNYPVLTDSVSVFHLELVTGSTLSINGNELTITGTLSGTGRLVGSLTSSLVINGSDTNAIGTVYFSNAKPDTSDALLNLTYNRSGKTLYLGSPLKVYGVVTPTAGVLSSGGNVVLKSNSSGTARIAAGSGTYITGDVTVERYIPNTGRRYRLLAPMVTTSNIYTINQCWMEGGMNVSLGANSDPKPGYGTHITGVSNNVNGFDYTVSSQASLFTVTNGTTPTYSPVLSVYNYLDGLKGYFLFVRGHRNVSINLQNTNVAPSPIPLPSGATTLRATGVLTTDSVVFTGTGFYSMLGSKNVVANPYVSSINWASVYAASENISSYYTLWDPSISFRGGFVTVGINGVASAGSATNIIQPGQAFFVQATGAGTAKVTIKESHKISGNSNSVFAPVSMPVASLQASLYYTEGTGYRRLADGTLSQMDNGFTTAVDPGDALKIENWDEGLAIDQAGKYLAIEQRNIPAVNDTLNFSMSKMKLMNYQMEVAVKGYTALNLQPYLVDRFTGSQTLLKNNESTVVSFSVTTNTASSASNRFYVVFRNAGTLPVRIVQFKASAKGKGVQVHWQVEEDESVDHYEVERSKDQSFFQKIGAQMATGSNLASVQYSMMDNDPFTGNNFYRLKLVEKSGEIKYSKVQRVNFSGRTWSVSVFPNPFKGTELQVKLDQWPAGNYRISITDVLGRVVYNKALATPGGNLTIPVSLKGEPSSLKSGNGMYWLKIEGEGIEEVRKVVRE